MIEEKEYRDYLTGVWNRMGLFHIFDSMSQDEKVQVLFFDIDNFKTVNDMYGHNKGDDTLIKFAQIVEERVPQNSIVARLGGDEFVAVIPGENKRESVAVIAENALIGIKSFKEEDKAFGIISGSIGIMLNYPVSEGLDAALNSADKAMYFAKEQGKDTYVFYEDYEKIIDNEKNIEMTAVRALEEGRFIIEYHPIHHLHSSKLICAEACCLWKKADGTLLGRNEFRPILVKNGFINQVDLYIFEKACQDFKEIHKVSKTKHRIGIQFSHLLLMDDMLVERLDSIMNQYGVDASNFEINLDEKICGGRIAIDRLIRNMKRLSERGFSIALSRFGEDFSSVRYLKDLPLSSVKLDGEFIIESIKDEEGIRILKSIIELGRGFKFTVVACRVDDDNAMITLAQCGCDAATGNYFSKKLSLTEYLDYVKRQADDNQSTISYRFTKDFATENGLLEGKVVGEDIKLVKGISSEWGAVSFPGGPSQTNYLKLPTSLFEYSSYTVSMWVKPYELQNWVSALYVRYQGGFMSYMPNISGGRCIYRINEDAHLDAWHDAMTGANGTNRWSFVAFSYDSFTAVSRLYIDGELEAVITGVPNMSNPKEVWIGGDVFQISYCGLISALQINKGALEGEEIKSRYEAFRKEEGFVGDEKGEEVVMTEIEIHDPAVFEDPIDHHFYLYGTDAQGFVSSDLLHWKSLGRIVKKPLDLAKEWTKSDAIWAPDIVKVGDEYRLYCSNSSWGVQQSCIFLAVSDKAQGPFIPKAIVLKTDDQNIVNGIDANIIEDYETKEQYMVYGSFWGGVHIIALDKKTGLAKEGQGIGKQIACRPLWNNGAIEGPYIIYHPETEYYYLFVSYGSLTCDYNIRVGRSKRVCGPYVDYHGNDMVNTSDPDCTTGLMVSCGYRWLTGQAYMGPGHNSVLLRENGDMYLVSHIRKLSFNSDPGPGLLQIRKMIMTPDGWPIALGQPYNAETLLPVRDELLIGEYERIELRPSIPQGIQHAHPMKLYADGRLEMASVIGTWKRTSECTMILEYGPITEFVHFEKGLDKEKNKTTAVMGGLTSEGICTWAKKEELIY